MTNTATSVTDRDEVQLEGVLKHLEGTVSGEPRLEKWLYALQTSEGELCLQCSTAEGERFYRWTPGGLLEIDRHADATFGPRTAGPVRTQAAIGSADTLALVPAAATPFEA
jgi:hypothetical protein